MPGCVSYHRESASRGQHGAQKLVSFLKNEHMTLRSIIYPSRGPRAHMPRRNSCLEPKQAAELRVAHKGGDIADPSSARSVSWAMSEVSISNQCWRNSSLLFTVSGVDSPHTYYVDTLELDTFAGFIIRRNFGHLAVSPRLGLRFLKRREDIVRGRGCFMCRSTSVCRF